MSLNLEKFKSRIEELATLRYRQRHPIEAVRATRLSVGGVEDQEEQASFLREGDRWGERDAIYQIAFDLELPTESKWHTASSLALHLDFSTSPKDWILNSVEGLLYLNDKPLHALDRYHREIVLPPEFLAAPFLSVRIRMWTGLNEAYHTVGKLELRCLDAATDSLYALMKLTLDAANNLSPTSPAYLALLLALDEACNRLDFRHKTTDGYPAAFYDSVRVALGDLQKSLEELKQTLSVSDWQPHLIATGHAHIDVAWLWRLTHTRLKAANTFSTALYHMERYPYFVFTQSQPQLYQFVKEDHPELFARIKQKVATGQWEPEGAMWIEADTNITGGESLVRQFLFGQRYFEAEFGVRCKVLWLPDVFGYSAALPQLIKAAGVEYFVTSKISWNDTNRLPVDTFWWQGLDGTQVLTYFLTVQNDDTLPIYTYNGDLHPSALVRTWKNYQQKDLNRELLMAYGWGDGGGGPTRPMIEAIPQLSQPLSADLPTVEAGGVARFMERLAQRVGNNPAVPKWVGELYLEYHRGTYTSQGWIKRANRLAERDLHNVEWLWSLVSQLTNFQAYPREQLAVAWQTVLTNQFHDILPGSSIAAVYEDARTDYEKVAKITTSLIDEATHFLAQVSQGTPGSLVVFNPTNWQQNGLVELETTTARRFSLPQQELANGHTLVAVEGLPVYGYRTFEPISTGKKPAADEPIQTELRASKRVLENSFYRLELNEHGQLTRLLDKGAGNGAGREVLTAGARGNVFQLFEDKPVANDAWDIDSYYEQKMWELDELVSCEVVEQGPLRAGWRLEWVYAGGPTRLVQHIYLYRASRRIDFVTTVDWWERQTLLKVAFPVDIHSERATAEIQFGNIERPTHANTSWDKARFETCVHKWVDLSERGYGVALLNDCKYGYDVHTNTLRLTLLKGAIAPDPQADQGHHFFTYSLLPHEGDWFDGGVPQEAYALNYELLTAVKEVTTSQNTKLLPANLALVEANPGNVVVETVKRAEDNEGLVVRFYECANQQSTFQLRFAFEVAQAYEANLLEEKISDGMITIEGACVRGVIRPYEVKTLVITGKNAI